MVRDKDGWIDDGFGSGFDSETKRANNQTGRSTNFFKGRTGQNCGYWSDGGGLGKFNCRFSTPFKTRQNEFTGARTDGSYCNSHFDINRELQQRESIKNNFEVTISGFPWHANELTIKRSITCQCIDQFVNPKNIKIVNDRETGKPKFGYIKFDSQHALDAVLRSGLEVNRQKIRVESTAQRKKKSERNLDYIKKLKHQLQKKDAIIRRQKNELNQTWSKLESLKELTIKCLDITRDVQRQNETKRITINSLVFDKCELQNEHDSLRRESVQLLLDYQKLQDQKHALDCQNNGLKLRVKETDSYNAQLDALNKELELEVERLNHQFELPDKNNLKVDFATHQPRLSSDDKILIKSEKGTVKQEFKIVDYIEKGGFGEVYLVTVRSDATNQNNKQYCIKLIKKCRSRSDNKRKAELIKQRFQAEMDIQSKLDHNNIVKLHMCFQNESFLLLQLEYCQKNLREYTQEHLKTKTPADIYVLVDNLFCAVAYLHDKNIIHRDIKPVNILMKNSQILSWALCDFGLAVDLNFERVERGADGTTKFLPPEVVQGKSPHTKAADIWSCGTTLLKTLKNKYPSQEYGYAKCNSLPVDINLILTVCFQLDPNSRPPANRILGIRVKQSKKTFILVDESNTNSFDNPNFLPEC